MYEIKVKVVKCLNCGGRFKPGRQCCGNKNLSTTEEIKIVESKVFDYWGSLSKIKKTGTRGWFQITH